jgi:hypothetical protein
VSTTAVVQYVFLFARFKDFALGSDWTQSEEEKMRAELTGYWDRMEDVEQAIVDMLLSKHKLPNTPRRVASDIGKSVIAHVDRLREQKDIKKDTVLMTRAEFDDVLALSDEEVKKTAVLRAGPPVADLQGEVLANTPGLDSPEMQKWLGDHVSSSPTGPTEPPGADSNAFLDRVKQVQADFGEKARATKEEIDEILRTGETSMGAWVKRDECSFCKKSPPCPHMPTVPMNVPHFKVLGAGIGNIQSIEKLDLSRETAPMHTLNPNREYFVGGTVQGTFGVKRTEVWKESDFEEMFADPATCPFIHDNIERLFGVQPMKREDLPKTCTCGAPLTYSKDLVFITGPSMGGDKVG